MPIYEYICENCGRKLEILVQTSNCDIRCPYCGSVRLKRKISSFSAHGTGSKAGIGGAGQSCSSCAGGSCSTCSG